MGIALFLVVIAFVAGILTTDEYTDEYNRKRKNDFNYIEFKDEHRWR